MSVHSLIIALFLEINYNDALTGVELEEKLRTAERHRKAHYSLAEAINSRYIVFDFKCKAQNNPSCLL